MSRIAVVTGASSGLGSAVTRRLAERGLTVIAAARHVDAVPAGPGIIATRLDLTDPGSIHQVTGDVLAGHGRVDVIVNNAGTACFAPLELTSAESALEQIRVNVLGPLELTRLLLPAMRQAGQGRIVNISSVASRFSSPAAGWYHATKAALETLSDTLRQEVTPHGITVTVVQPGVIRTPFHQAALRGLRETGRGTGYEAVTESVIAYHEKSATSPMASSVEDVADVVLRAALDPSPRSRYAVGRGARTAMAMGRFLPDRVFDAMVRHQFASVSTPNG
jgi:NAD(P)-dependent dehydrogenase (short-subunit alcohol dehydrogenase family)